MAAGVDGIFFATQMATTDLLTREEYEEFGRPYDLQVLEAATTGLIFLHIQDRKSTRLNSSHSQISYAVFCLKKKKKQKKKANTKSNTNKTKYTDDYTS